ncbi:hypothetical protein EJ110_NYTH59621 [Nymphaea thermarum]|nr:hypothetical protein EJ110_NYTH59621 [Nymphaea thermarum]
MSVIGHRKEHVIEENEPVEKSGKYGSWKEDNNIVMSWIMNSVQPQITSTIAYYTSAKQMWDFLKQTYSNDKNVSKILQGLSPEYAVAKAQMLTGTKISDLVEAYNRLNRLNVTLSLPSTDTHPSALVASGGRECSSFRGRGIGRGLGGGRRRFQCTYYGKIEHLENRCWDKHGRPFAASIVRNAASKQDNYSLQSPIGYVQAASSVVEGSLSSSHHEIVTMNINKSEYEEFLAHRSTQPASIVMIDSAMSVNTALHDTVDY